MRLVLDTNILISALWTPTGLEAQLVALALHGRVSLAATFLTWREYTEVLARPKFAAHQSAVATLLAQLETRLHWFPATEIATAALDPSDNLFLACAAAAQADYLITGNRKHYPERYGLTSVRNARQFFDETQFSVAASAVP